MSTAALSGAQFGRLNDVPFFSGSKPQAEVLSASRGRAAEDQWRSQVPSSDAGWRPYEN